MTTPRLLIPEITESQNLKYLTHNEALRLIDAFVDCKIIDRDLAAEPGSPSEGDFYILPGSGVTGTDWAGNDGKLAHYYGAVWYFYTVFEGFTGWISDEQITTVYTGSAYLEYAPDYNDSVAMAIALG